MQTFLDELLALCQRGGVALWAIAALSVIGTIAGILQLVSLSRRKHVPRDFEKDAVHLADTKGMDAGISLCKEKPSSLARVLLAALVRHGLPLPQLEAAVRNETALVRFELLRRARMLGWFAAIAPILGLLGLAIATTKHVDFEHLNNADDVFPHLAAGFADGLSCVIAACAAVIVLLGFYFAARARAADTAHDIELKGIESVVTLDRKGRQSIRLIEDIEEKIKTESMIKVPDLSAEFDEQPHAHESALKTAVTTHAGGAIQE